MTRRTARGGKAAARQSMVPASSSSSWELAASSAIRQVRPRIRKNRLSGLSPVEDAERIAVTCPEPRIANSFPLARQPPRIRNQPVRVLGFPWIAGQFDTRNLKVRVADNSPSGQSDVQDVSDVGLRATAPKTAEMP